MASQNRWALGQMYTQGRLNGVPFYTQPGGPGTQVFPTEKQSAQWPEYPVPGLVINEFSPWVNPGCLHAVKEFCIIAEYDYDLAQPVSLLTCPTCSYVQRAVYGQTGPAGSGQQMPEIYDPNLYAVVVG